MAKKTWELVMSAAEVAADHEKWLKMRSTGIGGSDAAVITGHSRWASPFHLWMLKTGQEEVEPTPEKEANELLYWGHALEDLVANRFTELTGKKVQRQGMIRSTEYPWMLADVDRVVVGENAILECKTTASWNADKWKDDNVPDAYYIQCQHYMAVTGCERTYIACLVGGNRFIWKAIDRNEEDIAGIIAAEKDFWENYVVPKRLPAADASAAFSSALAKTYPGNDEADVVQLDGEYDAIFDRISGYKEQIKTLEKLKAEEENKIKEMMENNVKAMSPRYKITYTSAKVQTRFDRKQFEKDYPKLIKDYLSESKPIRTLWIKERDLEKEQEEE